MIKSKFSQLDLLIIRTNWNKLIMKKILIILLTTIFALFIFLIYQSTRPQKPILTPTEWKWLSENEGNIRYAAPPKYPPVSYTENNLYQGLTEEYVRRFEKMMNIKFKRIIFSSWEELMDEARKGQIDLIGAITKTPLRSKYLLFSQPYITIDSIVTVRNEQQQNLIPSKMKNQKIAVTGEYAVEEYLMKNYPDLNLVTVPDDLTALKKLSFREVDAAVTDLAVATYLIEKHKISNVRISGDTGFQYNNSFATRRDLPILNSIIIKNIASISPEDRKIFEKKWITIEYNRFLYSKDFWVLLSLLGTGIILIFILIKFWDRSLRIMVTIKTKELNQYKDKLEEMVKERTTELEDSNTRLRKALTEVKTLSGLLPICSNCKKVRDDTGYWDQIENYICEHSDAEFSHSLCPECTERFYGNKDWYRKKK